MRRGYLLPEGCKDLIDVLPLERPSPPGNWKGFIAVSKFKPQVWKTNWIAAATPLPPIVGELVIPDRSSVAQLAALLGQKPFQIIADLLGLGVFAGLHQPLDFDIISRVARKYGFVAKPKG